MISQFDEAVKNMGFSGAPIRFKLHLNLVKIKTVKPIEGKKLVLKMEAMGIEKQVEVDSSKKMESQNPTDNVYSIN